MLDSSSLSQALSPLQIEAVRALLSERNRMAAAAKVGVDRVTLWRWLKKPACRQAVIAGYKAQIEAIKADIREYRL